MSCSSTHLLIENVPYVNSNRQIAYGTLASQITMDGPVAKPASHVALWAGEQPCDFHGAPLTKLGAKGEETIRAGLNSKYVLSQKPPGGYADHYDKMVQYIRMISDPAKAIDPSVSAHCLASPPEESVFWYMDTASGRADIASINAKLHGQRIAIVGLGGTGSYVLDLVAKTCVREIHVFDDDRFFNHNAFRSPGAPSREELSKSTSKAGRFADIYSRMHRYIIKHEQRIDESNVAELYAMDVVFLCVDNARARRTIASRLAENGVSFIDVGMGILKKDGSLTGSCRITTCTRDGPAVTNRIPSGDGEQNEYSSNIQVADLNALNAALAVIRWKRMCGFYHDLENEHNTTYAITTNALINDEKTRSNNA